MRLAQARTVGVPQDKLDQFVIWRETDAFLPAERAAPAWVEALTCLDDRADLVDLRAELRLHFSDEVISVITADTRMINLWNRV